MAEQKAKKESYGGSFGKASLQSDDDGPLEVDESAWFGEPGSEEAYGGDGEAADGGEAGGGDACAHTGGSASDAGQFEGDDLARVGAHHDDAPRGEVDNLTTLVEKLSLEGRRRY